MATNENDPAIVQAAKDAAVLQFARAETIAEWLNTAPDSEKARVHQFLNQEGFIACIGTAATAFAVHSDGDFMEVLSALLEAHDDVVADGDPD